MFQTLLLLAPIEFVKGIISGYFSGDGSIDINTKTITARSISEKTHYYNEQSLC